MEAGFPSLVQVRAARPGELAVLLSEVDADEVCGWGAEAVEAFLVATQMVASWASASQVVAVSRFVELVADDLQQHIEGLAAEQENLCALLPHPPRRQALGPGPKIPSRW
ncbi:MAG: hypothetical protein ACRCY9_08800 [Phycicoccus sp.]